MNMENKTNDLVLVDIGVNLTRICDVLREVIDEAVHPVEHPFKNKRLHDKLSSAFTISPSRE